MAISMYSASVPVAVTVLQNLASFLDKAQGFVEQKKCDPNALLGYRLAPDMLPFTRQIQIACDAAKNGLARVSGSEAPKFEDSEASFADLKARIQKTLDHIKTYTPQQLDGKEAMEVSFAAGPAQYKMTAEQYLKHWMLPNLFFHATTAYAILRHNGVELGKRDFLAGGGAPF
jgi:uncharacterized protein